MVYITSIYQHSSSSIYAYSILNFVYIYDTSLHWCATIYELFLYNPVINYLSFTAVACILSFLFIKDTIKIINCV